MSLIKIKTERLLAKHSAAIVQKDRGSGDVNAQPSSAGGAGASGAITAGDIMDGLGDAGGALTDAVLSSPLLQNFLPHHVLILFAMFFAYLILDGIIDLELIKQGIFRASTSASALGQVFISQIKTFKTINQSLAATCDSIKNINITEFGNASLSLSASTAPPPLSVTLTHPKCV